MTGTPLHAPSVAVRITDVKSACATGIANLVVWPQVFEKFRRTVMAASMMAVQGRIQREGEVVHLVAHRLADLSGELASVGNRDAAFPLPHGRGDQVTHAVGGPDQRERPPRGLHPRHIDIPDVHRDTIEVKSRDFR
jgi:error-prone DNA polymerase